MSTKTSLLKIEDLMAELQISRTKAYRLVASGELRSIRIGRSIRVTAESLAEWIQQKSEAAEGSGA